MRILTIFIAYLITQCAAANASPETDFIKTYENAHSSRDVVALKNLHCLDRVPSDNHTSSDPRFYQFNDPIKTIQIVPTTVWPLSSSGCDAAVLFVRSGVKFELNLPVVAALHIEYVPGKNSVGSQSDTPLGFKNGRYWILSSVLAAKNSNSALQLTAPTPSSKSTPIQP